MKHTLHSFFERTAHSKDANEFLLRFHSIPEDQFLLIIPSFNDTQEIDTFIGEIKYLIQLELYPSFYLSDHFLSKEVLLHLNTKLNSLYSKKALKIITEEESTNIQALISYAKKVNFYKILICGAPVKNDDQSTINRIYLNNFQRESKLNIKQLEWIQAFLDNAGYEQPIQITEPNKVLQELFTHKGAGTLVSLGYHFSHTQPQNLDQNKAKHLIEEGFSRTLKSDYFSQIEQDKALICIEKEYRGILTYINVEDFYYLDKVVVSPQYFGQGLGSLLLDELLEQLRSISKNHPSLIWRAKKDNPFLNQYAKLVHENSHAYKQLNTIMSDENYVYHIVGLEQDKWDFALKYMQNRPNSFI